MSADVESLRIFFFSDWRIQPLELAEELIRSIGSVDLIVYGGDDVARFGPLSNAPKLPIFNEIIASDSDDVVLASQQKPDTKPLENPLTTGGVSVRFHNPVKDNWLSKISSHTRYGVVAIIGNDCQPDHRAVLNASGVRDIHASPTAIGGWGFIGIEGGIYRGTRNRIGHVLHADGEVKQHLTCAFKTLGVPPERLVIVSHTPPAGCRLDYAIRFGFHRLGSKTLQNFVLKRRPALVLSGHCHSRGGKHAYLGDTLVVNGASDDTRIQGARVTHRVILHTDRRQ